VSWQAPGETGRELLVHLDRLGVCGKRVAVQRDGGTDPDRSLSAMIAGLGADVVEVPVYRWRLPDDVQPAQRLIAALTAGRLDAVTFTSAIAVDNLFELARDEQAVAQALSGRAVAVAVGPVTAEALRRHGVDQVVEPARARLGAMVQAVVAALSERASVLRYDGLAARRQGCAVLVDGSGSMLTAREAELLDTLLRRAPAVVAKAELVEPGADEHAAEMAVTRLRTKLGPLGEGIIAVPRRGYRCVLEVDAPPAR
jgi:uroporphyrinogen-III synthase